MKVLHIHVLYSQGNPRSRDTLLNNKIVDYLNLVLRKADFEGCSAKQVIHFREEIGRLLYSLIEENGDEKSCAKVISMVVYAPRRFHMVQM